MTAPVPLAEQIPGSPEAVKRGNVVDMRSETDRILRARMARVMAMFPDAVLLAAAKRLHGAEQKEPQR